MKLNGSIKLHIIIYCRQMSNDKSSIDVRLICSITERKEQIEEHKE